MASTFFGLNTAYTGLTASNAALNTTANNIANVETKGYSRQKVEQKASDAIRTFTTYGSAGAGVDVIAIERIRDEFYDVKYWNNNSKLGENETKQYYAKSIENYFIDDSTLKGFSTIFNEMQTSLATLKTNAGDTTVKTQFIGFAGNLCEYFNGMSEDLTKLQQDVNAEIQNKVNQINSLAEQIASLNKQINVIELSGIKANELRDQRGVILDQLSSIVDVEVSETPVFNVAYPDMATGANNYIVKIAGGQTLVNTNTYRQLECVPRAIYEKVNQSDAEGLYDIYWTDTRDPFGIYGNTVGGELSGLIQLRDGNNGESFEGILRQLGTTTITSSGGVVTTHAVATIEVTDDYLKDLNKSMLPENGGIVNIGNQEYYYDSWTYRYDDTTGECYYDFVLSDSTKNPISIGSDKLGKPAAIGESVAYQGIPYYMQQMNEWVRNYAAAFNEIATQTDAVDGYGNATQLFFTGDSATSTTQFSFTTSIEGTATVQVSDDSYYRLTARNFAVNAAIEDDSNLLSTRTVSSDGQEKYDIVGEYVDLATNEEMMRFRGSSAGNFLQSILADVALNASSANGFVETYTYISGSIETQRASISGVDNDEEALNLVKFQNAYNLSSKMIQVLTEVYDRLILQTGV